MTSANGYTTIINYNYSADKGGSWILTDKTVKTDNYDDPWIYDGKHRECITYTYDREKKEFIQNRYDAYDWIRQNPNILQWTYKYGGDMTRRFLEYDDAGNLVNYDGVYPFKDGRYCSEIYKHIGSSSQELDEITWVYYATDGKKKQDIDYVMWMLLIDQPNLSKFSRMVNGRSLRFLMRPLNWNWETMNSVLTMNSIRTDM